MALINRLAFLLTLAALLYILDAHTLVKRSDVTDEPKKTPPPTCLTGTPCGWAVYNKSTRMIHDFWENRCICNSTSLCIRDHDQLATSTYVYKCKLKK